MGYIEKTFGKTVGITEADLVNWTNQIRGNPNIEWSTLELKQAVSDDIKHLFKPIIGFANFNGGLLILGIEDQTYTIHGILESDLTKDSISSKIRANITPLFESYNIEGVLLSNGKYVYLIDVSPGNALYGTGYIVSGSTKYLYFIRKNHETLKIEEIDPLYLNKLIPLRLEYEFKKMYRDSLKGLIDQCSKSIAGTLGQPSLDSFVSITPEQGITLVKNLKLRELSTEIFDILFMLYKNIANMDRRLPKVRLTLNEELRKNDLVFMLEMVLLGYPDFYYLSTENLISTTNKIRNIMVVEEPPESLDYLHSKVSLIIFMWNIMYGMEEALPAHKKHIGIFGRWDIWESVKPKLKDISISADTFAQWTNPITKVDVSQFPNHFYYGVLQIAQAILALQKSIKESEL